MQPCPYNQVVSDYKRFYLTWIINNICTNHCRYCPKYLHEGKNHHYDWSEAEYFIDSILEQHPMIHLVISGGEPTVSPFLPKLLKKFASPKHYAGVSSNGVRKAEYWDGLDVENLGLSYHPAFHDDGWVERANQANQYVKQVTVNLMMDPDYWDHCMIIYDQLLNETDVSVIPTMIVDWGSGQTPTYTEQQQRWFLDNPAVYRNLWVDPIVPRNFAILDRQGEPAFPGKSWTVELINRRENNFGRWECDIGLKSAFVQFDGSYRRANCEQGGYSGWIRDGYKQVVKPVICGYTECQCLTDISIPKRKQSAAVWRIQPVK